MANKDEYVLANGDTFLLPTNAVYRINDKLDDASDFSSVYSNEPELAIGDGQDADDLYMDDVEFAQRLFKFGLDVNGLPLRNDLIFKTFDEASDFTLQFQRLSFWEKFAGGEEKPAEVKPVI
ncbi:unnamed protein product [Gongylonema pulchrum]|uniref:Homogentisate 1,2-dioxygenase n=1 Tax=Gongylonema pulchrum TaxID=637853 RepID=A0A183DHY9_9BILA|nr:unnamed protein product [Gongylonema pulchrum]